MLDNVYYSFYINRDRITVFRFQLDLITKQNNEDANTVLLNRSCNDLRVCNELSVLGRTHYYCMEVGELWLLPALGRLSAGRWI